MILGTGIAEGIGISYSICERLIASKVREDQNVIVYLHSATKI